MHDTARRLHGGRRRQGTTLDRFRLNELVSQIAFWRAARPGLPGDRQTERRKVWGFGSGCRVEQRIPSPEAGRRGRTERIRDRNGSVGLGRCLRAAPRPRGDELQRGRCAGH
jgi:hypothetical protein